MTVGGTADRFAVVVDRCEELGFDSLWVSERIGSPAPDPLVALAVAAGRTERMKLGTSVLVLPGRNPVILAKEMASLDVLSGGRFLPGVGLGIADPPEQRAFGVERKERGRRHDEALDLMRKCWTGEVVSHRGDFYSVDDVQVLPVPVQDPLSVWLGGAAPPSCDASAGWATAGCRRSAHRPTSPPASPSSRPLPPSTAARWTRSTTAPWCPTATARSPSVSSSSSTAAARAATPAR